MPDSIVFFCDSYLPNIGGVQRHIENVSKALVIKNINVVVITIHNGDNELYAPEQYGIEVIYLKRNKNILLSKIGLVFQLFVYIKKILKARVWHFHDYSNFLRFLPVIKPLSLLFKKKIFITFHGWEGFIPPKRSIVCKRKICEIFSNGNMCVGHFIQKWYGTNPDIVIYGGVDSRISEECTEEKVIMFLGRLAEDSGCKYFIEAWGEISKCYPEYVLLVCGDGPLRNELENSIKENKVKNVEFMGMVKNPFPFIKRAQVIFTTGYLGILESLYCKRSVIAVYDNPLKKDYLNMIPNSQDIMWITDSSDGIVNCFPEALENRKKGIEGHKFAKLNTWDAVAEAYLKLWRINSENSM